MLVWANQDGENERANERKLRAVQTLDVRKVQRTSHNSGVHVGLTGS
jgi:hypothetical protein